MHLRTLALGAALLAACSEEAPRVPSNQRRVAFELAAGAPPVAARASIERHVPLDELERWSAEAPVVREEPLAGDPAASSMWLIAAGSAQDASFELTGSWDLGDFNEITIDAAFSGRGELQAFFLDGERELGSTNQVALTKSEVLHRSSLSLPADLAGACDRIRFALTGPRRGLGLHAVELGRRDPGGLVPSPDQPALVQLGDEWRHAVGLTPRRPLRARVEVSGASTLGFAFGESAATHLAGRPATLVVEGPQGSQRFELGGEWQFASVALPTSGELTLRLEADRPAAAAIAEAAVWTDAPRPRSVLLFTTDTHRGDHLGSAGLGIDIDTPNFDRLAAEGVRFERAFSSANHTNPSHVAVMTGVHPRDTQVWDNRVRLNESPHTLAEIFAEQGYVTWAAVSARHLLDDISGLGQGFDRMTGPSGAERSVDDTLADIERWLPDLHGRPLFLWFHAFDAHTPYEPPGDYDRRYYDPAGEPEPWPRQFKAMREMGDVTDLRLPRAQYKAEIAYLDTQLPRLFDLPLFRDGIVAVAGDHGEALGEHHIYFSHYGLYPELLHVPLMLRWPEAPAGRTVARHVAQMDVGATLLELAGFAQEFPGDSLLRHLDGADESPIFALHSGGISASVTAAGHHAILHLRDNAGSLSMVEYAQHQLQLFDLDADPKCANDLVDTDADRARSMRALLVRWLQSAEDVGWTTEGQVDSAVEEQLEQLGYVESTTVSGDLFEADGCAWCTRLE